MWSSRLLRLFAPRITTVDTPDANRFPAAALRARLLQLVLVGAAIALVVAAATSARDLETRGKGLLPDGSTGVIVVDLSLSIEDDDYNQVRRAFRQLIAEDASIGLVVFSDVAYELLPPGTPASALQPILRLLVPPRLGPPVNPWMQTFRAGTKISTAVELAKGMLERDGVKSGSILLVSDLETAPDDVPVLARTVDGLRQSSIDLRVVALAPSSDARRIFAGFVEEDAVFEAPSSSAAVPEPETEAQSALPIALLVLAALLFLVLAAHERFGSRLALQGGRRAA
jgi:hypothetical protein